jgi:hypothetical protein
MCVPFYASNHARENTAIAVNSRHRSDLAGKNPMTAVNSRHHMGLAGRHLDLAGTNQRTAVNSRRGSLRIGAYYYCLRYRLLPCAYVCYHMYPTQGVYFLSVPSPSWCPHACLHRSTAHGKSCLAWRTQSRQGCAHDADPLCQSCAHDADPLCQSCAHDADPLCQSCAHDADPLCQSCAHDADHDPLYAQTWHSSYCPMMPP